VLIFASSAFISFIFEVHILMAHLHFSMDEPSLAGLLVISWKDGDAVGFAVVGTCVGRVVGLAEGREVGWVLGVLLGWCDGTSDGLIEGMEVGL
jgi:hypothetical protein